MKEFLVLSRNENNVVVALLTGGKEEFIEFLDQSNEYQVGYVYKKQF